MTEDLKQQLRRDEGLRLEPYRDTVGKLTIGIGRNLDDRGITEPEALHLLENDIEAVRSELDRRLPWIAQLDDARRGVLLNMAFNMGVDGLLGFKNMLEAVEEGDYPRAAAEMENSRWWGQVGKRARRLHTQMLTAVWQ